MATTKTTAKMVRLGNPILREVCRELAPAEIKSDEIKKLIRDLKIMVAGNNQGVGISANQLGFGLRISVIAIKSTLARPNEKRFDAVLINPQIAETFGRKIGVWEGCLSAGTGDGIIFGRVPRFKKVRVKYLDESGVSREIILTGLPAHVIQHEIDHLNGEFFLDKAARKSLMMADEYRARVVGTAKGNYYDK